MKKRYLAEDIHTDIRDYADRYIKTVLTNAKNDHFRSTRKLPGAGAQRIDFDECEVALSDTVLLCTDGLTNCIDDELIKLASSDNDFVSLAERLVELANQNGGNDNITVVAVKI